MPEKTSYDHGAFCWAELESTDQQAAATFYSRLFGWETEDLPIGEGDVYTQFKLSRKNVGAVYRQQPDHAQAGLPSMWNSYIAVDDVDQIAKAVDAAGGKVIAPPFDVMESGRMAVIQDPTGGIVGLWEANQHIGAQVVDESNAFSWNELLTSDPEKAKTFFSDVFGWTYDAFEQSSGTYWVIKVGDQQNGGIMSPPMEMPVVWTVYLTVDDTDATVSRCEELGGSVAMPAQDFPEVGRVAWLTDPQGATFGVIQPVAGSDRPERA